MKTDNMSSEAMSSDVDRIVKKYGIDKKHVMMLMVSQLLVAQVSIREKSTFEMVNDLLPWMTIVEYHFIIIDKIIMGCIDDPKIETKKILSKFLDSLKYKTDAELRSIFENYTFKPRP